MASPGPPALATNCPRVTGSELALATDNEGHLGSSPVDGWAFYGQGPSFSYFDGCSDGGREGASGDRSLCRAPKVGGGQWRRTRTTWAPNISSLASSPFSAA